MTKDSTMKNHVLIALVGLSAFCAALPAHANCDQTSASAADIDLWNIHGCWVDFINYQYQVYAISSDDWGSRGYFDDCNLNKEYPKHWNASYLVGYGLLDDINGSFHGTTDYENTAQKWDTEYHDDLYHVATDNTGIFGQWIYHWYKANEVQTSCLLYNTSSANANPGSRAGDFMHEGWHGWQDQHGYTVGHFSNPAGGHCTLTGANCDYFYFHGIGAYAFGAMWQDNGTASRFHSPNQVQVEFLCDVADFPQPWVPASVRQTASADANTRAVNRFINGPGYSCGSPRPW
jgi:hypothetical protein